MDHVLMPNVDDEDDDFDEDDHIVGCTYFDLDPFATLVGLIEQDDLASIKTFQGHEPRLFKSMLLMEGDILLRKSIRLGRFQIGHFLVSHNCSTKTSFKKPSPIHCAAKNPLAFSLLQAILASNADVDAKDRFDNTPLHWACIAGAYENVDALLKNGADCDAKNLGNQTPLHKAAAHGHVKCVKLLLAEAANVNARTSDALFSHTPLDFAIVSLFNIVSHENAIHVLRTLCTSKFSIPDEVLEHLKSLGLVNQYNCSSMGLICYEIAKPVLKVIDLLIQFSAEFNALVTTAKYISTEYVMDCIKLLICECGKNINEKGYLRNTVLHFATGRKFPFDIVSDLIDLGADVNAISLQGVTPIELALRKNSCNVVKLLIENGANINFVTDDNWSPLLHVLRHENIELAQFLLDRGADPNIREVRPYHCTPLMDLLKCPPFCLRSIELLLSRGADVNMKDSSIRKSTSLHMAAQCYRFDEDHGLEVWRTFISMADRIDPLDSHGYTPLMRAMTTRSYSISMIKMLLKSNADPTVISNDNQTALSLAIRFLKDDVISLLLEYDEFDYDLNHLLSSPSTINALIQMNTPYNREKLFAARQFYYREDINKERQLLIDKFISERFPYYSQDSFKSLSCCLYEMLRGSPFERKFCSTISSGPVVLFIEAERYLLKTKTAWPTDVVMKKLLGYRLEVIHTDNHVDAINREKHAMLSHVIFGSVTLHDLFQNDIAQLAKTAKNSEIHFMLSNLTTNFCNESLYPIFCSIVKTHIQDGLGRCNLLHSAENALNHLFSEVLLTSFKSTPDSISRLPDHILEMILCYLSNSDLQNLILMYCGTSGQFVNELKSRWWDKLLNLMSNLE